MTKYDRIVNWFQDNPIFAIILVILVIIMAIPQMREGVICVWRWIRPKKKDSPNDSFKVKGETVTYDELLHSVTLDIVRVNAHTHMVGVMAEHAWIAKRYPRSQSRKQGLYFLESDTKNLKDRKAFDIIAFDCEDGSSKEVCFEITSFFDGQTSSYSTPSEFARKKLREIYGM